MIRRIRDEDVEKAVGYGHEGAMGGMDGIIVYDGSPEADRMLVAFQEYNRLVDSDAPLEDCAQVLIDAGIWGEIDDDDDDDEVFDVLGRPV
ncbi:MAG: hypothetical protein OXC98_09260 [bacterium]|nr:hypothetical protein [Acidimicrobiia bacterium]MCY4650537.1 hypothetical protein [bacterium]